MLKKNYIYKKRSEDYKRSPQNMQSKYNPGMKQPRLLWLIIIKYNFFNLTLLTAFSTDVTLSKIL